MFGLQNFRGSCWVNACLQGIFRIPEVQNHYSEKNILENENEIDSSLQKIWRSNGKDGLKQFFQSVKHVSLPTGKDVGDSHELLIYLLDKLPWLESLCKFQVADSIECTECDYKSLKEDTKIELSLFPSGKEKTITDCIAKEVITSIPEGSKCEKCEKPYKKQLLLGSFPKVLILHVFSNQNTKVQYSSILVVNSHKYGLISILSYNGAHWWSYGRNKVGDNWYTLDDTHVVQHRADEFPLSGTMRILIYYQLDE